VVIDSLRTVGDILLAVNGAGSKIPQAVGLHPTTARLPVPQVGYLLVYDTTCPLV
jgi:hypothetical protein